MRDAAADVEAGVVAKFDLRLILTDAGGGLAGAIEYSTALFDAATMERMAGHLVVLLEAVAGDAGRAVVGAGGADRGRAGRAGAGGMTRGARCRGGRGA